MGKNVTVAQVMEIKKMADEKGVDRETFGRLYREFARVLDSAKTSDDIIAAIESGQTELWLHPDQQRGFATGRKILRYLTENALLAACTDVEQLRSIQAKGVDFWRKHFARTAIFAWRSVEDDHVWCLCESGGEMVLSRYWLDQLCYDRHPALRLRK